MQHGIINEKAKRSQKDKKRKKTLKEKNQLKRNMSS